MVFLYFTLITGVAGGYALHKRHGFIGILATLLYFSTLMTYLRFSGEWV